MGIVLGMLLFFLILFMVIGLVFEVSLARVIKISHEKGKLPIKISKKRLKLATILEPIMCIMLFFWLYLVFETIFDLSIIRFILIFVVKIPIEIFIMKIVLNIPRKKIIVPVVLSNLVLALLYNDDALD